MLQYHDGPVAMLSIRLSSVEEMAMKELLFCRAMESRCRQRAALYPSESGRWLAEAEMWQRKAMDSISDHFDDCNTNPATIPSKGVNYKYTGL
jgi:hypothetical protein